MTPPLPAINYMMLHIIVENLCPMASFLQYLINGQTAPAKPVGQIHRCQIQTFQSSPIIQKHTITGGGGGVHANRLLNPTNHTHMWCLFLEKQTLKCSTTPGCGECNHTIASAIPRALSTCMDYNNKCAVIT